MELETPIKNLAIGGVGCKMCRYWARYTSIQLALYRLVGTQWGRCLNSDNVKECLASDEAFKDTSKDRANVDVERLSEDTIIISTTENYTCSKFKGKKKEDIKNGNN